MAKFYNCPIVHSYSYCCRSPGLQSKAIPNKSGLPSQLTFWHWAGLSPYTLTYVFAQTCVFVKQSPHSLYLRPIFLIQVPKKQVRHLPKLRLANLPSSLRKVLSLTLVYSTSSPVSVCGTDLKHSRS